MSGRQVLIGATRRTAAPFGLVIAVAAGAAMIGAEPKESSKESALPEAALGAISPRRVPPEDRFDFRGEHHGVIHVPEGWSPYSADANDGRDGRHFVTPRGFSIFIPYDFSGHGHVTDPVVLGTSYEIVRRSPREMQAGSASKDATANVESAGRYETRAEEIEIPGEYVEVYRPAVYELDDAGREQLVEKETIQRVPKVRVVLRRAWAPGSNKEKDQP